MPATSNFREALREAEMHALVGPNVVRRALPYVGGGLALTAGGVFGGLSVLASNPGLFFPTFWVALIAQVVLFFVAQGIASSGRNSTALPLLATYSLLTGYTLTGLVAQAVGAVGIGGIGIAALATGITFIVASQVGSKLSEESGLALGKVVGLGLIGLLVAMVLQLVLMFIPGTRELVSGGVFELAIAGFGTVLFAGAAVLDFYTMPRTYQDDQYLVGALSMYLTYINLFIFILRFIIAVFGGSNRD